MLMLFMRARLDKGSLQFPCRVTAARSGKVAMVVVSLAVRCLHHRLR